MSAGVVAATALTQTSVAPALSTGAVVSAPAVATAATAAVTVVAAAAAAVIVAKVAISATEAGAEALIRLDQALKRQADERVRAEQLAEDWAAAAAAVAARNAAIRSLTGSAARVGVDVPLPPPLDLTGRNLCQIRDWCVGVDRQLSAGGAAVQGAVVTATAERMRARVPKLSRATARTFAERYADVLAVAELGGGPVGPSSRAASEADRSSIRIAVEEVLAKLPTGIDPDTYQAIMVQAALAADTPSISQARTHVDQLRHLARSARATAAARAEDERFASRLLDLFGNPEIRKTFTSADEELVAALREVAAGGARLDPSTRSRAERRLEEASAAAQRAFLLERTVELLEEFGYDVSVERDETGERPDRVQMTGGRLGDARAAVFVSAGELAYQMYRDGPLLEQDAIAEEAERCGDLGKEMTEVTAALGRFGVSMSPVAASGPEAIQQLGDEPVKRPDERWRTGRQHRPPRHATPN
ncbi:hypothetical protein ACPXB5_20765 [Micromonospora arida]|uniref:hypothetical protein n=1 Tax=Micromonospora arida TaxID=2203715 RepID=UPI003CF8078E